MENHALNIWRKAFGDDAPHSSRPRTLKFDLDTELDTFRQRREVCATYGFAVPTPEALKLIASYGDVIEIGAGTGFWAELLRDQGIDVMAVDPMENDWTQWFPSGLVGHVEMGDHTSCVRYPERTLLMIWPSMDSWAGEALQLFAEAGGQRVVYIGEGCGGCTANDSFFEQVGECYHYDNDGKHNACPHPPPQWEISTKLEIPCWEGLHDQLWVLERRKEP